MTVEIFQNLSPASCTDPIMPAGSFAVIADIIKEMDGFALPFIIQVIIQFQSCKRRNEPFHRLKRSFSGLHLAPNFAIYTPTGNRTNALLPCQSARRKLCRQPQPKAQCPAFPIATRVHIGSSCNHHLLFVKLEVVIFPSHKSGKDSTHPIT